MGFASVSATAKIVWRIMLLSMLCGRSIVVSPVIEGISGYSSAGMPTIENSLRPQAVSYTHLDVYKRQLLAR